MRKWAAALIFVVASSSASTAEVLSITWAMEGDGQWWDSSKWNPIAVPNNGPNSWETSIGVKAEVILDSASTTHIDSLTLDNPAASLGVSSPLEIVMGGVSVDGELDILSALRFHSDEAVLTGSATGKIVLAGGSIEGVGSPSGAARLTISRPVSGAGSIGNIKVVNVTAISADAGVISIFPNDHGFENNGVLVTYIDPDVGAFSRLDLHAVGKGDYFNTNGIIEANDQTEVRLIGARIFGGILRSKDSGRVVATSQSQLLSGVSFSGVLDIDAGKTVELDVFIQNDGVWNLNGEPGMGAILETDSAVEMSGGGQIIASDTNSNAIQGSGVLINTDHTIAGAVRIEVGLINDAGGLLLADAGATNYPMTLATLDMVHNGLAMAIQGGTMRVTGNEILGNGSWRADGGNLLLNAASVGTCGTLRVDPGHLETENSKFRAASFRLGANSSVTAFKGSGFRAAPSEFRLTDGLTIETQDEAAWDLEWFPETKFIFYGGLAAEGCEASSVPGTPSIEIGGTDGGNEESFYENNFQIPRVVVGPGAHVQLADVIDNGNRNGPGGADEALYVRTLEFADADGRLALNGLPLYYQNLIGDASQIIAVPEPGAVAQLVVALAALARISHRRRAPTTGRWPSGECESGACR